MINQHTNCLVEYLISRGKEANESKTDTNIEGIQWVNDSHGLKLSQQHHPQQQQQFPEILLVHFYFDDVGNLKSAEAIRCYYYSNIHPVNVGSYNIIYCD